MATTLLSPGALLALALLLSVCWAQPQDNTIRLNHIQTLHVHNTYHQCPVASMDALYNSAIAKTVTEELAAFGGRRLQPGALSYGHEDYITLVKDMGVRSIEVDVHFDPEGGRYAFRAGPKASNALGFAPTRQDVIGPTEMFLPGTKVLHLPDIDFQTSCHTVVSCLRPLAQWSRANPTHTPLFVSVEIKEWRPIGDVLTDVEGRLVEGWLKTTQYQPHQLATSPDYDVQNLYDLFDEIQSVFNRSQIITPDDFRGGYESAQERIKQEGWPSLDECRGKVIFRMLGVDWYMEQIDRLWPGGKGSLVFMERNIGNDPFPFNPSPDTVFVSADWPRLDAANYWNKTALSEAGVPSVRGGNLTEANMRAIADLYRRGLEKLVGGGRVMIRVPADTDTWVARIDFRGYGAAALAGGVHFLHTDYPAGSTSKCGFKSDYTVLLTQVHTGTYNPHTMTSLNTSVWPPSVTPNNVRFATVCNPVTGFSTGCTVWEEGSLPDATCTCYSPN